MKKIILLLTLAINSCLAGTVTLQWDASVSTNVAGYKLFASTNLLNNTNYTKANVIVDVGTNLIASVSTDKVGTWYFGAVAYGYSGTNKVESNLSNILPLTWPAPPANAVMLVPQYIETLGSTNWQDLGFFRLKLGMP
jgi:hypothetical protein